jgi:riboflavin synthase
MFTGIIKNTGIIKEVKRSKNGLVLKIKINGIHPPFNKGSSVAVNGACLTITDFQKDSFFTSVVRDTLRITNLSLLKKGSIVNIEFPVKLSDSLEGHMLEGHIDGTGKIISFIKTGMQFNLRIKIPNSLTPYIVTNGSIGLDGVSLTIKNIKNNIISATLIPFTIEQTNFKHRKSGDEINIEVDRMGKYVENFLKKYKLNR